jgi:hypothetical protein
MLYTSIDILKPAKVTFPADVDELIIINNTIPQPQDYGHKTDLFNEKTRKFKIDTDSLPFFCLASFAGKLNDQEFFRDIKIDFNSVNRKEYFFVQSLPSDSIVKVIMQKNKSEGVISLNRILVTDQVGELYDQVAGKYIAYLEAVYETSWSVHFPSNTQKTQFSFKDTVYWESESYTREKSLKGLPDRRNALIDGAMITGEKAVRKFIPYWEKVDRYFFESENKIFKAGIDSVYTKNWQGAIDQWENLLQNSQNSYMKAKICHNIAVACEIKGDVKKAYDYSGKALQYMMNSMVSDFKKILTIAEYNDELRKRVTEVEKVNKQLGE